MNTASTLLGLLIVAVVGPVLLHILNTRAAQAKEERDYARQDAVAERAQEAAELLARNTAAATQVAKDAKESTDFQLERIHTLVNSNMTAQMEDSLASKKAELVALLEVIDLKKANGIEPTSEALATIATIKTDIARKEAELADRLAATARADSAEGGV